MKWELIESAPKDGTDMILYGMDGEIATQYEILIGYYFHSTRKFYTIDGIYIKHPTHWMPLPEPPK